MKLLIDLSELGFCAIAAALFVFIYVPLGRLTGGSFVPVTIGDFLYLYVLHFCIGVALYCLKNLWKKEYSIPTEDDSENGNVT